MGLNATLHRHVSIQNGIRTKYLLILVDTLTNHLVASLMHS